MWVSETYPDQDIGLFVFSSAQFDSTTPWTITATDGTNTASDTVLITTNKEYEITLSFYPYAFKYGGAVDTDFWGTMNITHPSITTVEDTIVGTSPSSGNQWTVVWASAISASKNLSKICLDAQITSVLVASGTEYALKFGVSNRNDGLAAAASYCVKYQTVNNVAARQTYELDVSDVTSGYLFVGGVGAMTVYNYWGVYR